MASVLETLVVELTGDATRLNSALRGAEQQTRTTSQRIRQSVGQIGQGFRQLSTSVGGLIGSGGIVFGLTQAARAAQEAEVGFRLFTRQLQRSNQDVATGVQTIETLAERLGVVPERIQDNVTQLLRQGLGIEEISRTFEGAAASALAAGRTTEQGIEAVSQAIVNQQSIFLNQAGIAENLNVAYRDYAREVGKSVDELSKQERAQAAVQLVMNATKEEVADLDTLLGGFTGETTKLNRALAETQIAFGELARDALTPVIRAAREGLEVFLSLPEPVRRAGVAFLAAAGGLTAVGTALAVMAPVLGALAGPAGLIIVAAGAAAALAVALGGKPDSLAERTNEAGAALQGFTGSKEEFLTSLDELETGLTGLALDAWDKYRDRVRETEDALKDIPVAAQDAARFLANLASFQAITEAQSQIIRAPGFLEAPTPALDESRRRAQTALAQASGAFGAGRPEEALSIINSAIDRINIATDGLADGLERVADELIIGPLRDAATALQASSRGFSLGTTTPTGGAAGGSAGGAAAGGAAPATAEETADAIVDIAPQIGVKVADAVSVAFDPVVLLLRQNLELGGRAGFGGQGFIPGLREPGAGLPRLPGIGPQAGPDVLLQPIGARSRGSAPLSIPLPAVDSAVAEAVGVIPDVASQVAAAAAIPVPQVRSISALDRSSIIADILGLPVGQAALPPTGQQDTRRVTGFTPGGLGLLESIPELIVKGGEDSARIQKQEAARASEQFANAVVGSALGFANALVSGEPARIVQSLFSEVGSLAGGLVGGPLGSLIGGGLGILGGVFGSLFGGDDEDEGVTSSRFQDRGPAALTLTFEFNQTNSLGGITDPQTQAALNDQALEGFRAFEEALRRTVVPRLEALETAAGL